MAKATNTWRWNFGARAIALQADDKILVTGTMLDEGNLHDFGLARYDSTGMLDLTFGRRGLAITDLGGVDNAESTLVQPDGQILVAGRTCCPDYPLGIALVRYKMNGSLDATFGKSGIAIHRYDVMAEPRAMKLQPDGKIVVTGFGGNPDYSFFTSRFNPNGSLDTTFARGGRVITSPGKSSLAMALAIQPDQRIVVAGYSETPLFSLKDGMSISARNGPFDFALARYLPQGKY